MWAKTRIFSGCLLIPLVVFGCTNPQKRSAEAQAVIDEQKAEIMRDIEIV